MNKLNQNIDKLKSPEVGEVYNKSFEIFKSNIAVCIANTLIAAVTTFLVSITIIGILVIPAIWGGYAESMIRIVKGEKIEIGDFFTNGFNKFGKLLGASILYSLGVFFGMICFIIPGIYLMFRWFFVFHLLVDKDLSITEAFECSGRMSSNIFWDIVAIGIINWLIKCIGGLVIVIGGIFTVPLTAIAISKFYIERFDYLDDNKD